MGVTSTNILILLGHVDGLRTFKHSRTNENSP